MRVIKRDGREEPIAFDKITLRIKKLCGGLDSRFIDPSSVALKVIQGLYDGITTRELDTLAAETCAFQGTYHPDWSILAARIAVSDCHKQTEASFSKNAARLHAHIHPKTGAPAPLISDSLYEFIQHHSAALDAAIDHSQDFAFDFFGFKTLERSYLLRINGEVAERPQQMLMRVALGIHCETAMPDGTKGDLESALQTYKLLSQRVFTHATPTLFNAGTPRPQLSSCFLLTMKEDSIEGIFATLKDCASISKYAGGIGLSIHNIRATDSYIRGTNGTSNGIVPMLRVFSDTARYVDQGGGKRKGSFAVYLEPWHADIFPFLELKKNHGKEEMRARDLFYALWIPDLFMKRVEENGSWSLFCPNEAPGLADTCGDEFEALFTRYEKEGRARKTIRAQELWSAIMSSQIETGTPYMLFKDAANLKSNQQNLGVIKSSNLCTEILEYTSSDEIAVCNLASIAVNSFVRPKQGADDGVMKGTDGSVIPATASKAPLTTGSGGSPPEMVFDFEKLRAISGIVTRNLNRVIDVSFYPVPEARNSNVRHRPIGIGIQGFADACAMLRFPYESNEAAQLNKEIFEALYFGAVEASVDLSEKEGHYESYPGSPASKGKLQFDLWDVKPTSRWDWAGLKAKMARVGIRNSLLLAPMPTASTAQILGNNESFEPFTTNLYNRRVLAGEFCVVNRHLLRELISRDLWTPAMRMQLLAHKGSVQSIPGVPQDIKECFKTVWEIKQRTIIDYAADRGPFICQSQSLNLFLAEPTVSKLTSAHFHAWKRGLKTGMYYLRTRPKADAIPFTIDQVALQEAAKANAAIASGFTDAVVSTAAIAAKQGQSTAFPGSAPGGGDETDDDGKSVDLASSSSSVDGDREEGGSGSGSGGGNTRSELSLDGSPIKLLAFHGSAPLGVNRIPAGSPGEVSSTRTVPGALTPGSMMAAINGAGFDSATTTPKKSTTPTPMLTSSAEQRKAEMEARKAAIRAAMQAGTYEHEDEVCINCSS